jgi:hypothetical protein
LELDLLFELFQAHERKTVRFNEVDQQGGLANSTAPRATS